MKKFLRQPLIGVAALVCIAVTATVGQARLTAPEAQPTLVVAMQVSIGGLDAVNDSTLKSAPVVRVAMQCRRGYTLGCDSYYPRDPGSEPYVIQESDVIEEFEFKGRFNLFWMFLKSLFRH